MLQRLLKLKLSALTRLLLEKSGALSFLDNRYAISKNVDILTQRSTRGSLYDLALFQQNELRKAQQQIPWQVVEKVESIDFCLDQKFLDAFFHIGKFFKHAHVRSIDQAAWGNGEIFVTWGNTLRMSAHQKMLTVPGAMLSSFKPLYVAEDGFIRSIVSNASDSSGQKFQKSYSMTLDDLAPYYTAYQETRMEQMIAAVEISDSEKERSRNAIDTILKNYLSKYNHQPLLDMRGIMRDNILVIDQVYNDFSVLKGGGQAGLKKMIKAAIDENPDKKIIVKIHPDNVSTGNDHNGFYGKILSHKNVELIDYACNPIALIKHAAKVYVFSSQLGFEAVMMDKEVHTFGVPFYAGWGLTTDHHEYTSSSLFQNRRDRALTKEEVFHVAYLQYSRYLDRDGRFTNLEKVLDIIREDRKLFFSKNHVPDQLNIL